MGHSVGQVLGAHGLRVIICLQGRSERTRALAKHARIADVPTEYEHMERGLPTMPVKSRRWVGEMEEIAKTFERVGLTPRILTGAADLYRFVGSSDLAERTPEDTDPLPTLDQMISALANHLPA